MRDIPEMIAELRTIRQAVCDARAGIDIPQVERALDLAEMNLHWALWSLGDVDSLLPEDEEASSLPQFA